MKRLLLSQAGAVGVLFVWLIMICSAAVFQRRTDDQTKLSRPSSEKTGVSAVNQPEGSVHQTNPGWIKIDLSPTEDITFPVVPAQVMGNPVVHLAVSLHSNDTWFIHKSDICPASESCLEPDLSWRYDGLNGVSLHGHLYKVNLTITDISVQNLNVAVLDGDTFYGGIEKANGVLGLGPGSPFLNGFRGSKDVALYLGDRQGGGSVVIGGYFLKSRAGDRFHNFPAGSLRINLKTGDSHALIEGKEAEFNTESPYINVSRSDLESIAGALNSKVEDGWIKVADNNRPSLVISLGDGGLEVVLEYQDYIWLDNDVAKTCFTEGSSNIIMLGRPALKKLYLIREEDGPFRIAPATTRPPTPGEIPIPIPPFPSGSEIDESPNNNGNTLKGSDPATGGGKTLAGTSPTGGTRGAKSKAGAIVGGVVGLILIILAISFIFKRRLGLKGPLFEKLSRRNGDPSSRAISAMGLKSASTGSSGFSSGSLNRKLMGGYEPIIHERESEGHLWEISPSNAVLLRPHQGSLPEGPVYIPSAPIIISPLASAIGSGSPFSYSHPAPGEDDDDITIMGGPNVRRGSTGGANMLSRNVSISTVSGGTAMAVSRGASLRDTWRGASLGRMVTGRRKVDQVPRLPMYTRGETPDPAL